MTDSFCYTAKDVTSKIKNQKHQADTIVEEVQSECLIEEFSTGKR